MSDGPESTEQGQKKAREKVSDAANRGMGMLSAFKEALEETIHEARERGDLTTDRARDVMKSAMNKAKSASSDAREKFDFVSQADFDGLAARVADLEDKVRSRIGGAASPEPKASEPKTEP